MLAREATKSAHPEKSGCPLGTIDVGDSFQPSATTVRELRAAEFLLEPHGLDALLERCRVAARDG